MNTDEHYMGLAIEEARQAKQVGELPIGAIIICKRKVIARNRCREVTEKTVLAHTELQALNDACKILGTTDLSACVIYCSNEPCLMCAAALFQAKISRIVIGASRSDLPHLLRDRRFRIDHLAEVRGILKEKVLGLFAGVRRH